MSVWQIVDATEVSYLLAHFVVFRAKVIEWEPFE